MKKDQKTLLQRMFIGFKKGYQTPTLPQNILDLHNHPATRIYRVVCGLSLLLLMNKKVVVFLSPIICYSALAASFTFLFYMLYISYHRIRHISHVLKNKELDIRNSPPASGTVPKAGNRLASVCGKLLFCVKGICEASAPVATILGFTVGIDSIRESSGFKPIFTPIYAKFLLPKFAAAIEAHQRSERFKKLALLAEKKKSLDEYQSVLVTIVESGLLDQSNIDIINNEILNEESVLNKEKNVTMKELENSFNDDNNKK